MAVMQCTACHGKKKQQVLVKVWGGRRRGGYVYEKCPRCKGKGHVAVPRSRRRLAW